MRALNIVMCLTMSLAMAGCVDSIFGPEVINSTTETDADPSGTSPSAGDAFGGGQIAYVSESQGANEIFTMKPGGSTRLNLTDNSTDEREPAWSPDGSRIAFVSPKDGDFEIYVMDADAPARVVQLTSNSREDRNPAWSPDGTKIAFRSGSGRQHDIYVMNADGTGEPVRLTDSGFNAHMSWSPDGEQMVFTGDRGDGWEIYVMNADGSGVRRLTHNSSHDGGPDWSPTGRKIAFHGSRHGDHEILVINPDGTGEVALTSNDVKDFAPEWSPNGEYIAYRHARDIYIMGADGSHPVNFTTGLMSDFQPTWGVGDVGLVVRSLDESGSRLMSTANGNYSFTSGPGFAKARTLLAEHFPGIEFNGVGEVTVETLKGTDVFVINQLSQSLGAAEICALEVFVDRGGALLEVRDLVLRQRLLGTEPGERSSEPSPKIVNAGSPVLSGPFGKVDSGLSTGSNFSFRELGGATAVTRNTAGPNIVAVNSGEARDGRAVLIGDDEFFMSGDLPGGDTGRIGNRENQQVLLNTFAYFAGAPGLDSGADFSGCAPNGPPSVGEITAPVDPVAVGTVFEVSASFTDPGTSDTHTASFHWGDGNMSDATVTESNGSGSIVASHAYSAPGVYTLRVVVEDNEGQVDEAVYKYVVAYDPAAGFITGGGWIHSPAGAYKRNPDATGKATFGFVSKYEEAADTPTGNTEFKLHVGQFSFHAASYDWLVVKGPRARYTGEGSLNGVDGYAFMLTGIDGALVDGGGEDAFRIKIWDAATGEVVYDSEVEEPEDMYAATPLGGGSIVIHKKR